MTVTDRVRVAVAFAAEQHGHQARKGAEIPYRVHPLNVAKALADQVEAIF